MEFLKLIWSFSCLVAVMYKAQARIVMLGDSLSDDGRGANTVRFQEARLALTALSGFSLLQQARLSAPDEMSRIRKYVVARLRPGFTAGYPRRLEHSASKSFWLYT